jgi:hypothetical protein
MRGNCPPPYSLALIFASDSNASIGSVHVNRSGMCVLTKFGSFAAIPGGQRIDFTVRRFFVDLGIEPDD